MRKHFLILMLTALLPFTAWAQADPATKTAPAAKANLVYNGAEQALVDAAVLKDDATEGTAIYYAVVNEGSAAPAWADIDNPFATTIAKKKDAGSYDVYYLTRLSSTNSNIVKAATVTIAKADLLAKAKDVTHYYTGAALTTGTGLEIIYDGWKGDDGSDAAHITAALDGATIVLTSTQVAPGSQTIIPQMTAGSIKNYNFVPVSGKVTIVKAKLQIAAKDMADKGYGTDGSKEKAWEVTATTAFNTYFTLKQQNNAIGGAESFGDALALADDAAVQGWIKAGTKIKLNRNGDNNVGEKVLTPSDATLAEAIKNNYEFVYKTGTFTIVETDVTITPANGTKVYGEDDPTKYPYNLTVGTLTKDEEALIVTARTTGEAAGTYDITVSGPAKINGYNVTYDNAVKGKFMITQRPVTVTALPQLLYTGDTYQKLNVAEVTVEGILDGDPDIEVALNFDETVITADANVGLDASTPKKLTSDADTKEVEDAIVPALKAGKEYPNYKFTFVPGDLTVVNLATVMLLTDTDDALTDKLTAANNKDRNISFGTRALKAETWNVLVLPFATTVKEISEAFGYAVVDILDETASDGNIHLKLHMGAIPANTPFIVKNYANKDLNTVLFAGKKIEYTAAGENVFVEDAAGNKFIGTYKSTEVYGANIQYMTGKGVFKDASAYTDASPLTLKPLRAYIETVAQNNAGAAPIIFIEEPDGSTTAIETVSAVKVANGNDAIYNLAGQKVGADFKGIVIKNGKRYVQK